MRNALGPFTKFRRSCCVLSKAGEGGPPTGPPSLVYCRSLEFVPGAGQNWVVEASVRLDRRSGRGGAICRPQCRPTRGNRAALGVGLRPERLRTPWESPQLPQRRRGAGVPFSDESYVVSAVGRVLRWAARTLWGGLLCTPRSARAGALRVTIIVSKSDSWPALKCPVR